MKSGLPTQGPAIGRPYNEADMREAAERGRLKARHRRQEEARELFLEILSPILPPVTLVETVKALLEGFETRELEIRKRK